MPVSECKWSIRFSCDCNMRLFFWLWVISTRGVLSAQPSPHQALTECKSSEYKIWDLLYRTWSSLVSLLSLYGMWPGLSSDNAWITWDWANDEVEDVNDNCDFETEDEVKDDFSYHQFQDVVYNYWRHLSKLTCMISRRFVVFYCLTMYR